jgi:hypothetical protein
VAGELRYVIDGRVFRISLMTWERGQMARVWIELIQTEITAKKIVAGQQDLSRHKIAEAITT